MRQGYSGLAYMYAVLLADNICQFVHPIDWLLWIFAYHLLTCSLNRLSFSMKFRNHRPALACLKPAMVS
jgi:hypothetical protein